MSMPADPAILDIGHLDRITLGDSALAAEVLRLFSVQARALRAPLATDAGAAAAAHKLKGSARAIGAFAVERAVAAFEDSVGAARQADASAALDSALAETECAIKAYCATETPRRTNAGVGTFEPL